MPNTILVATAGGAADETAEYVARIAAALMAKLVVLHVADFEDDDAARELLERFAEQARKKHVEAITVKQHGEVIDAITTTARRYDVAMIVMGASQGSVLSKWLSSRVFDATSIPVVVIPHNWMQDENESD